jgi:hypothetical protein
MRRGKVARLVRSLTAYYAVFIVIIAAVMLIQADGPTAVLSPAGVSLASSISVPLVFSLAQLNLPIFSPRIPNTQSDTGHNTSMTTPV